MSRDAALQWVRAPAQGRSQETLARLLDATERLLDERPFDRVTVQDIVSEARASVGSFYARFDGKDALLYALFARYVADGRATAVETLDPARWDGVPLVDAVTLMCAFIVDREERSRGLRRALVVGLAHDERLRREAADLARFVVDRIAELLAAKRDEMTHDDPVRAADFVHRLLFSVLDQIHVFTPIAPTGRPLAGDALARELTRAVHGYLGLGKPKTPSRRS